MVKIVTIVGARPQFIKAAVVSRAIRARPDVLEILVHTGQHYDRNMSEIFFMELGIPLPDYSLGVGSKPHGAQTGEMLSRIEEILLDVRPHLVLVYGDTNSTLAGAVAAAKLNIPVAHVEAGLRSGNRQMPEEINRIITDHVSAILYAPSERAAGNLQREGVSWNAIEIVGDVMYDAAIYYAEQAAAKSVIIDQLDLQGQQYVLATVHRAENTNDVNRLAAIVDGVGRLALSLPVVLPLHPRTVSAIHTAGLDIPHGGQLKLIDPVGYLDMVMLEKHAELIVTDSGGIQKEAYFHGVRCVTLRDETEWVELVELGWNRLVSPLTAEGIVDVATDCLAQRPASAASPYGDGTAGEKIASHLLGCGIHANLDC